MFLFISVLIYYFRRYHTNSSNNSNRVQKVLILLFGFKEFLIVLISWVESFSWRFFLQYSWQTNTLITSFTWNDQGIKLSIESNKIQLTYHFFKLNQNHDWNYYYNTIVWIFTVIISFPQTENKKHIELRARWRKWRRRQREKER